VQWLACSSVEELGLSANECEREEFCEQEMRVQMVEEKKEER
jgi:hypothetical protein